MAIARLKSVKLLWHNENLANKELVFVPFNPLEKTLLKPAKNGFNVLDVLNGFMVHVSICQ